MSYDFYDRLKKGETADEIAKAITAELNKAMKQVDEERKAEEDKIKVEAKKHEDAQDICDLINAYLSTYTKLDTQVHADELVKMFDNVEHVCNLFDSISTKASTTGATIDKSRDSIDDVIDNFLAKMKW